MSLRKIKIAIYYRKMPGDLERLILANKNLSWLRDGVYKYEGIKCPRGTLTVRVDTLDRNFIKTIVRELDRLVTNNLIFSYIVEP